MAAGGAFGVRSSSGTGRSTRSLASGRWAYRDGTAAVVVLQRSRFRPWSIAIGVIPMATFRVRGLGGLSVAAGRADQPREGRPVALLRLSEGVA